MLSNMSEASRSGTEKSHAGEATDAAPDTALLEQTRQQIRALVAEIAELAKSDLTPEQFYPQFLDRVVSALAAVGGAVWAVDGEGRLSLQYQINLHQARLDGDAAQRQHGRLLSQVFRHGEPLLVPPRSGGAEPDQPGNPSDHVLVFGLLKTDLETIGLVEIMQRPDGGPNTQRGYLRFVGQMCELAAEFLKSHQLRHFSHRQVLWARLEEFCRAVHADLNPQTTAYTVANEGRRLIECDRLTVVLRRGSRYTVEAISGQDVFERRSNTVRLLEDLAAAVAGAGDPVWYSGDSRDLAPQVEEAIQSYVDESHSKTVAVLPLTRPQRNDDSEDTRRDEIEPALGALVVEQIEDSRIPEGMAQRATVVVRHSSTALANALDHHSVFLLPLWQAVGRTQGIVAARNRPWVAGALCILVALGVIGLWPAAFEVESPGSLQPVVRRHVYAGAKGRVAEVLVRHGDQVRAGQLLVQLRDPELEMAATENEGQRITLAQRVLSLERLLLEPKGMAPEERLRVSGELAEARERLQTLAAQRQLFERRLEELRVVSPIDGVVITWDVENRLMNLPVQRGQLLLTVADPSQAWQLELDVPERHVGRIVAAQRSLQQPDLPVRYQLATDPGQTFTGHLAEIHLGAEVRGEHGNTVQVKVRIEKDVLPHLRPGATTNAKVYCGRRPLIYVWFHDVWAFWQSRVVFRYL